MLGWLLCPSAGLRFMCFMCLFVTMSVLLLGTSCLAFKVDEEGGLRLTLRQVHTDEGWIRFACCLPVHGRCEGASQSQDQEKKRATA